MPIPTLSGLLPTFDGLNNANYNGLLTSLTKRAQRCAAISEMCFLRPRYTWSHNLDNGSGFNSRISSIPYYNHHQFYGNSDFDLRQRFTLSGGWELPFAKAWANGPKRLTSGWSLYPIFFIQSGIPLDFHCRHAPAFHRSRPIGSRGWRDCKSRPNGQLPCKPLIRVSVQNA